MSAAQIQIILSSPESFAGLIGQTLSLDNATRRDAEDLYGQLKQQRPDACATNLLQLLRGSGDPRVRATCAVFLRKFFKPGPKEAGWEQLNRSTKTVVKRELLAALAAEADRTSAKQAADAVLELGSKALAGADKGNKQQSGWPELLASLQAWLQAGAQVSPVTREAALQVVAGLAGHLRPWSSQLAPVVTSCLGQQHEPDVQVAALSAVSEFLAVLRKPRELRPFQAALATGLTALQGALAGGHLGAAEKLLVTLIQTAEVEAGLWQPHVATAVPGMLALASQNLPDDLRKLAAEFVLTLTDIKPQMVQGELGAGPLAAQLVGCVAHFLTSSVEDEPGWAEDPMAAPDMDEDDTLGELHRHGLECATRAADSLDSAAVLRAVVDMTSAWARDGSDWRRRHAVLMCLSQVVGSCKEVVGAGELSSLAALLVEALRDPHPRVRWAACHAVGVLSDDLGPGLQLQPGGGGAALLQALAELLKEADGPATPQRVKAQACRALVGFLDGLDNEEEAEGEAGMTAEDRAQARQQRVQQLVAPFLEPLSGPLLANVERCAAGEGGAVAGGRALIPTPLQECSLDVLTHLAVSLKSTFAPVFSVAMPRVLAVLARAAPFHGPTAVTSGAVTEEEAAAIVRVQVGALECAAFMCRSAGPAAASAHLPELASLLGLLARPDLEPSSPLLAPLLGAVEPMASCLGPEARQLLGPMLPLLVQWASRDVGLKAFDDDESSQGSDAASDNDDDDDSEDSDRDDSDVALFSYGRSSYRCSASILAAKAAAVSSLDELVDKMGPALAQQVTVLAETLVPRLLDYYLEEVHANARRAVPHLLRSYLTALTHGSLPASDPAASPATAQALLHRIWQTVTAVINPVAAEGAAQFMMLPDGTRRPAPTSATRADMVELLTQVIDSVEGTMLQQAWVAEAFGALQAAVAAAQQEAQDAADSSDSEDDDDDKSMEDDGSVDLEAEGSGADGEEEEDDGEETEEDSESPEAARERLRTQVEACVAAFTRKYGDAVAALAAQVLAAQVPEQQRSAVVTVRNGVVA